MMDALMGIPAAAYESIRLGFEAAGYHDQEMISAHPGGAGKLIRVMEMNGVAIFSEPEDNSDICVNSGAFSDAIIAACKEAFDAGHAACLQVTVPAKVQDPTHNPDASREQAWSEFTPAQAIIDALHGA